MRVELVLIAVVLLIALYFLYNKQDVVNIPTIMPTTRPVQPTQPASQPTEPSLNFPTPSSTPIISPAPETTQISLPNLPTINQAQNQLTFDIPIGTIENLDIMYYKITTTPQTLYFKLQNSNNQYILNTANLSDIELNYKINNNESRRILVSENTFLDQVDNILTFSVNNYQPNNKYKLTISLVPL